MNNEQKAKEFTRLLDDAIKNTYGFKDKQVSVIISEYGKWNHSWSLTKALFKNVLNNLTTEEEKYERI